MTPLLIHRKLPVTARTAGRRDRPEAPTATPAFILLFFSSSEKWPEDENPLSAVSGTAAQIRPVPAGRDRDSAPPAIEAHRGSHGQTRVMIVFVLAPLGTGQLLLVNSIAIPVIDRVAFLLSVFGFWPQSGSGLLSERYVGGCLWETERSSPLIGNPRSICRLWPKTGGVVLGIPKGQLRRLRLGLPHRRPDHTDQRGELRSVGGRDALMQVLRQFQDHGL